MTLSFEHSQFSRAAEQVLRGRHVFVAGLTGSGAALLERALLDSGGFAALGSGSLMFVQAPSVWGRFADGAVRAQAGDDGTGAAEEAFWQLHDGDSYVLPMGLKPHAPSRALEAQYRDLVAGTLTASGAGRYLSRNANNLLRLRMLDRMFPGAEIVIPFRAPLQQARAMLARHRRLAACDAAQRERMLWRAQHEVGPGHRPFLTHPPLGGDPGTPGYWLAQWTGMHGWLLDNAPARAIFVYCDELAARLDRRQALARRLGVPSLGGADWRRESFGPVDARTQEIHDRLVARARADRVDLLAQVRRTLAVT